MNVKPYVYKLTHRETGEFYFGYRRANKVPALDDLGKLYFTSSKFVRPNFKMFNIEILFEFTNADEAFWKEQELIAENAKHPLILNRKFQRKNTKVWVFCGHQSEEAKHKISAKLKGKKHSKEHSQKIGDALRGRKLTPEELSSRAPHPGFKQSTKEKMSNAKLGKKQSPELIAKRVAKLTGQKRDNPCTVDGITIYRTLRELIKALGQGKNGSKSSSFRYIT